MKKTMLCMLCAASAIMPVAAQHDATIKETVKSMKTYPFSDPNPVANPSAMIYPYFRFDGFSAKGVSKDWKSVEMENDYIRLHLFPEVGGKVWGAVDKSTGKEFVYNNHVVKFRDIAMRGPWVSGGIEFNFGIIGHAPTSTTPIDYYIERKKDGSVSCYIASYEWITRTYWNVEVNLPKDKAYFTTTTTWFNQSDIDQPYYQWMNGGFKAAGNAEFCYPGDHYIGHGGDLHNFPIDESGRDISWYKNNNFGRSKSNHVMGYYSDYFGIYWHDDDFGSVHHADFSEKLGMKIFLWGQAREGSIWEDLLTDDDGQYIEMQSGRMYNQPASKSAFSPYKHHAFVAQQTDRWTEYWYPVKGIKGISKASRIGALHVQRENNDLVLAFSPLQQLSTKVTIYDGEQNVGEYPMKTQPMQPWKKSIEKLGGINKGNLRVVIGDDDLVYSERKEDFKLERPMELPESFDWNSAYGLYAQGEQLMNQKYNAEAEKYLKKALAKDAYFVPALNRLSSLYLRQGRGKEAYKLLNTSLSLNTYDSEANYLYGLYHQEHQLLTEAKAAYSLASYSGAYRSAAYEKLGEIALKEKAWRKAVEWAEKSLQSNAMNLDARQVLMMAYRKMGQPAKVQEEAEKVLAHLPLYHLARYEAMLVQRESRQTKECFSSLVRNELPFETFMELAGWYESVGANDEAIDILSLAKDYPIAAYKRAYLFHLQGRESAAVAEVERANRLSPEYVFPFRPSTLKAMNWAASISQHWTVNYYRGLICYANQRNQEALQYFDLCGTPDYAPFYLTRAELRKQLKMDYREDLAHAEKIGKNWRTGFVLIKDYVAAADWEKVVEVGERYMRSYPDNYYIGLKLAQGYCEMGDYKSSLSLLRSLTVLPNEGAYVGRAVYRQSNIYSTIEQLLHRNYKKAQRALDLSDEWPENLGVGKPYEEDIDARLEDYLQAKIFEGQGRKAEAKACYEKVADSPFAKSGFKSINLLTALSLKKLGRSVEADRWVASWQQQYPDNKIMQWCTYIYKGQYAKAQNMRSKHNAQSEETPWEFTLRDNEFTLLLHWVSELELVR